MSQQPPGPYGAPPPGPPYQHPYQQPGQQPYQPPQRKRPSAIWFAVGAVLVVLGISIGVALFVSTLRTVTSQDGVITANGQPATVDAPAGKKRMLFVASGAQAPVCAVIDDTGRLLPQSSLSGSATVTNGGDAWRGFSQIGDSGDGHLTLTCRPTGDGSPVQVRVGAPVDVSNLGLGIVGALAAVLVLGGAGLLILLLTTILWFTRKPRPQP